MTKRDELIALADDLDSFVQDMMEDGNDASATWLEQRATRLRRLSALEAPAAGGGEPVARKRPVAFRVRQHRLSNYYELYTNEKDAQFWADDRGIEYEGLYLVADRFTAPPADAGMREALGAHNVFIASIYDSLPKTRIARDKSSATNLASEALTAPGATTKSDGLCFCYFSCTDAPNCRRKATLESDGGDDPRLNQIIGGPSPVPFTGYGEYTPVTVRGSTSDPSSTPSEVTWHELALFLKTRTGVDTSFEADARALLDQFEIRRK